MIPFDLVYCRPSTLKEAVEAHIRLRQGGKNPVYYAGGSEIITMCRAGVIRPGAVIDIKNIPELTQLSFDSITLNIGSACTLNQIKESRLFPLLGLACGRIADHTNQCRITLGGNICGTIIYRETSLPLLLCDADISIFGSEGGRTVPFESVFDGRIRLKPDEIVVSVHIPCWALGARYFHIKKTANEKIDYPLVSISAILKENYLRIACSGICSHPFRSRQMEDILNNCSLTCAERAQRALSALPEFAYSDAEGSGEYRAFIFRTTLQTLLEDRENGRI